MSKSLRRRRQKLPSEPVELQITRLGHDGRGIAEIDGKIAFVSGALARERVLASFTGRRAQFDELKVLEVLDAAAERREPLCHWASICGGCSMQHMAVDAQVELKQQTLFDLLEHTARITEYERLEPLLDDAWSYRRKARLAVRYVHRKADVLVGFREKDSSFIADMNGCAVLEQSVSALIAPLRKLLYDLQGRMVIPQIEVAVGEKEAPAPAALPSREAMPVPLTDLQVALIVRHLEPLAEEDVQQLLRFAQEHELDVYLQPKGPDSVHKIWPQDDRVRLYYHLPDFNLKMAFHPTDFTQVNAGLNRRMIKLAIELLDLQPEDVVLDLFCGLGNFTLPVARHCAAVTGVEGSDEMVQRGAENAAANGIDNARFFAADLTGQLDRQPWAGQRYTKILLDPPRSGAQEIVREIAGFGAQKIVYISCNPATLARDAAILAEQGYSLQKAGVMDMFPHTSHVESIAEFVRTSGKRRKPESRPRY